MKPGEAWSDAALADLGKLDAQAQATWRRLLIHAAECNDSKPGNKWFEPAKKLVESVGPLAVQRAAAQEESHRFGVRGLLGRLWGRG